MLYFVSIFLTTILWFLILDATGNIQASNLKESSGEFTFILGGIFGLVSLNTLIQELLKCLIK